jgi:hypothetical protein
LSTISKNEIVANYGIKLSVDITWSTNSVELSTAREATSCAATR